MADRGLKKAVLIGAASGALLTLGIALSMDLFFSDTLQGTWRDAAAKDVAKMFGQACARNGFAVMLVLAVVMAFLAAFGAVLGAAAGLIMNRFFKLLFKL